jgi:hypothetical protein
MDDAANFFCGKALAETLCLAWLIRHTAFYNDLLNDVVKGLRKICDGSQYQSQPPTCPLINRATLDGYINWAKKRSLLTGTDIAEAEYIRDKRNDHSHAYAARLFSQTPLGKVAPPLGSDPDTVQTIRRTLALVEKLHGFTLNPNPV